MSDGDWFGWKLAGGVLLVVGVVVLAVVKALRSEWRASKTAGERHTSTGSERRPGR